LPHLANVKVEELKRDGRSIRIMARARSMSAACPGCGAVSRRVHSRYERRLLDTAAGGSEVVVCLAVRRFLCPGADCAKVTFAEQIEGLTSKNARRTRR
jgi:transposase